MSRYIDADILSDALRHLTLGETDAVRATMKITHYVSRMPTADVRENVRGEWRDGDCSHCGWSWRDIAYDSDLHNGLQSNFCPNCGADMRGDKNGK